MTATFPIDLGALQTALQEDPEFTLQARFLTARFRVVIDGVQTFQMIVVDGHLLLVDPEVTPYDGYDVLFGGSAEQWQNILAPVPPPMFQDFYPAMLHFGFRVDGQMETIMAYYPAIRRFQDVLRDVVNTKASV